MKTTVGYSKFRKMLAVSVSVAMLTSFSYTVLQAEDDKLDTTEIEQLNLRDVEIPVLVEAVSKITGKNFIVDPRVKGRVTYIPSTKLNKDELYETFLSILEVHGFSAVPSGNIIKVVPENKAKQQPVPVVSQENQDSKADELITKVIRVEHVPAAMLVPILRPLVPNTGQLQAYAPSNTIVISDRAANIERLIKVIKRMDRVDDEALEVIKVKHASAPKLAEMINKLRTGGIKKSSLNKNTVSSDERTNSLLVGGTKSEREQVRQIIQKLDVPYNAPEKTKVIYLKYAKAADLAKVLKTVSDTKVSSKTGATERPQTVEINADESSNSLIITAEPEIQQNLMRVIRRLDVRRAQLMVEAIVAEVSEDLSKNIGVQLAVRPSGNSAPVVATSYAGSGASLLNFTSAAGAASALSSGAGLIAGAASLEAGKTQFAALMNLLSGDAATNILSTPTLVTLDNEEASIVIGQNVPFKTGSYTSTGSSTDSDTTTSVSNPFQTIERQDVGLTLKIKPQINDGKSILLKIDQEVSSIAASNASASDLITNKRAISTTVIVEDGQILALGGLKENTYTDGKQKVPGLGDVPIVGNAFRNSSTTKTTRDLMVFIHPVILRDVLTGDAYTKEKYKRLRHAQASSGVANRTKIQGKGAKTFPNNLHNNVTHFTPEQLRQQRLQQLQQQRQRQQQLQQQRQRQQAAKRKVQPKKQAPKNHDRLNGVDPFFSN